MLNPQCITNTMAEAGQIAVEIAKWATCKHVTFPKQLSALMEKALMYWRFLMKKKRHCPSNKWYVCVCVRTDWHCETHVEACS